MEGERWWIASSHSGRARLLEWSRLLQQTAAKENIELGVIVWGTSGLQETATTSTIRAQLTTTSGLERGIKHHRREFVPRRPSGETDCMG